MILKVDKVNYYYNKGMAMETQALKNVSLTIESGQFVGIIGHTGSGKSTLHLNALKSKSESYIFLLSQ